VASLKEKQTEALMKLEAKPKADMIRCRTAEYTTVHIPKILAKLIDDVIANGEFGYSSRAEFIKDVIRTSLKEYGYYPRIKRRPVEDAAEDPC
jgi:Arc/MetJ-type ribon-helix-helix transcriptional regulator